MLRGFERRGAHRHGGARELAAPGGEADRQRRAGERRIERRMDGGRAEQRRAACSERDGVGMRELPRRDQRELRQAHGVQGTRRTASSADMSRPASSRNGRSSSYFHSAGTQTVSGVTGTSA